MPKLPRYLSEPADVPYAPVSAFGDGSGVGLERAGQVLGDIADSTFRIYDAEQRSLARASSSRAAVELNEYAASLSDPDSENFEPNHNKHEELFGKKRTSVFNSYRGQLSGARYQNMFDEDALLFGERIEAGVRGDVREKRIDGMRAYTDQMEVDEAKRVVADPSMYPLSRAKLEMAWEENETLGGMSAQERVAHGEQWDAGVTRDVIATQKEQSLHLMTLDIMRRDDLSAKQKLALADEADPDVANDLRARVKMRLEVDATTNSTATKETTRGAWGETFDAVAQNAPAEKREAILTNARAAVAAGTMSAATYKGIETYLSEPAAGKVASGKRYVELYELSKQNAKAFLAIDIEAEQAKGAITPGNAKSLIDIRTGIESGDYMIPMRQFTGRATRTYDAIVGVPGGKASKEQRAAFVTAAEQEIARRAKAKESALTLDEEVRAMDDLLLEKDTWGSNERVFEDGVDLGEVEAAARKQLPTGSRAQIDALIRAMLEREGYVRE